MHALHHRPRRAGASALLRIGGVVAGISSAVIILTPNCLSGTVSSGGSGAFNSGIEGGTSAICYVGVACLFVLPLAAMAVDDLYLARAPVDEAPVSRSAVAPSLIVRPGLAVLGLGASF